MPENDPTDPLGRPDDDAERSDAERSDAPDDPDTQAAILSERGPGAHAEKLDDEGTMREDDTAPGVDPDETA